MKSFLETYKSSIILLSAIFIGGIVGLVMGENAIILAPFGDLFLNMMFMVLVPLVFFSVTSAISNMSEMGRLGKILKSIVLVFFGTSLISAIIGLVFAIVFNPTKGIDSSLFQSMLSAPETTAEKTSFLTSVVNTITVSDFSALLSRSNMLQLIIISVMFGVSTVLIGEEGKPLTAFLNSATAAIMKLVSIIMLYAPIGLGCYFASVIGQLGAQIVNGYVRVFIIYIIVALIIFFVVYSLYALLCGKDLKTFWSNMVQPTVTAMATCSSAACIPVNLDASKNMGISKDIVETTIPLGANLHKDGSVIGGVFKIVFLFGLFKPESLSDPATLLSIIVVSILVGIVMGAIPGGGMLGEMLIITMYGFSPDILPIATVIATIIDMPATVLNAAGDNVAALLVSKLVDKK